MPGKGGNYFGGYLPKSPSPWLGGQAVLLLKKRCFCLVVEYDFLKAGKKKHFTYNLPGEAFMPTFYQQLCLAGESPVDMD
jgi:hypothetical protein